MFRSPIIKKNVLKIPKITSVDETRTINDVCNILDLSHGTCRRIWNEDINTMRTAATFVPLCWRTTKKIRLSFRKYLQDQAKQERNFVSKAFLFQKMKTQLKGKRWEDTAETAFGKVLATVRRALGPQWKGRYRHAPVRPAPPLQRFRSLLYFRHQLKGIYIKCTLPDVQ